MNLFTFNKNNRTKLPDKPANELPDKPAKNLNKFSKTISQFSPSILQFSQREIDFKTAIENYLITNPTKPVYSFLFWKGRVALYAILKGLGIGVGDEVILPAFTCVVVANPIIYLGAKPIYVDISPVDFNIDPQKVIKAITPKTKAIIAQNTFGLPPDLTSLRKIATHYNLYLIEDCAHGFGGDYQTHKNGTIADVAFFSTQWNKPFSTGIGGIAVTTNPEIAHRLNKIEEKALFPTFKEELMLKLLLFIREKVVTPSLYWRILKLYRFLSYHNLILGSSQGYELETPTMPADFLKKMGKSQIEKGIKYFQKKDGIYLIDRIISHRKEVASRFKEILKQLELPLPMEYPEREHTYLKFPLLVKNRSLFFQLAEQEKIELGDWFLSPIHPIVKDFKKWYYNYGTNPVGETISKQIVNLPTHLKIDQREIDKIEKFLLKHRALLIGGRGTPLVK